MANFILYTALFLAVCVAGCLMNHALNLHNELALVKMKLETTQEKNSSLKNDLDSLATQIHSLEGLSQSCLDRERTARADAEQWKGILEDMTLRELTEKEKKEVPDDKTRRALLDALDEPL